MLSFTMSYKRATDMTGISLTTSSQTVVAASGGGTLLSTGATSTFFHGFLVSVT